MPTRLSDIPDVPKKSLRLSDIPDNPSVDMAQDVKKKNIIDYYTGGKESIPESNFVARGLYQTGKDIATIPYHLVNQLGMNYPRVLTEKGGQFEYPVKTESGAGAVLANTAGIVGGLKNPILKAASAVTKIPQAAKALTKIPSLAKQMATGAALGGTYAQEDTKDNRTNAMIGGAIPVVGRLGSVATQSVGKALKESPARIVNSLIKPLLKDFSYGKNPGDAIAREGIVGNDMEDLAQNISNRMKVRGAEIEDALYKESVKKIDASKAFSPIDDALSIAMDAPRTNAAVINRLNDLKADLVTGGKSLQDLTPLEAWELKKKIGRLTKWTGNASDDKLVNKALKMSYGRIKDEIDTAVPGVSKMTERYADLLSAEKATVYRDKIESRQNLIKFAPKVIGGGGVAWGLASGSPEAVIAGIGAIGLDAVVSSPAFKTRIASGLSKMSNGEAAKVFAAYPQLRENLKEYISEEINKPYFSPRKEKFDEVTAEVVRSRFGNNSTQGIGFDEPRALGRPNTIIETPMPKETQPSGRLERIIPKKAQPNRLGDETPSNRINSETAGYLPENVGTGRKFSVGDDFTVMDSGAAPKSYKGKSKGQILRTSGEDLPVNRKTIIEKTARPDIPEFKGTRDAAEFGVKYKDDERVIKSLQNKYESMKALTENLVSSGKLDEALTNSQKAQLYREAVEAAMGKLNIRK